MFSYRGFYEMGEANGKGELIMMWFYYVGDLKKGKRHGHGCDLRFNSSIFLGNFKKDKRHGYGKLTKFNEDKALPIKIDWNDGSIEGLDLIT